MENKTKVKLGIGAVFAVLLIIFMVQNRGQVDVILITGKLQLPLAVVIFLLLAVGFGAGYLVRWATGKHR